MNDFSIFPHIFPPSKTLHSPSHQTPKQSLKKLLVSTFESEP